MLCLTKWGRGVFNRPLFVCPVHQITLVATRPPLAPLPYSQAIFSYIMRAGSIPHVLRFLTFLPKGAEPFLGHCHGRLLVGFTGDPTLLVCNNIIYMYQLRTCPTCGSLVVKASTAQLGGLRCESRTDMAGWLVTSQLDNIPDCLPAGRLALGTGIRVNDLCMFRQY